MLTARYNSSLLVLVVFILISITPLIFWSDGRFVGGDDTRLYYFYPIDYYSNFAKNIISDNHISGMGYYFPQYYILPLLVTFYVLKQILFFTDVQLFILGLNLALGFLAVYKLMGYWIEDKKWHDQIIRILTGLFYSFSIYLYFTQYVPLWLAIFLIPLLPFALYLFIGVMKTGNIGKIFLLSALIAFFSNFTATLPWIAAYIVVCMPIVFVYTKKSISRFIKFTSIFAITTLLLSSYYIGHFIYAPFSSDKINLNPISRVANNPGDEAAANSQLVRAVAHDNDVLYPLLNTFHKDIQKNFNWLSYQEYEDWSLTTLPINVFLLAIITLGLFYIRRYPKQLRVIYIALVISWLIALYFFTAKITNIGLDLFVLLTQKLPGFSMFRNMYDKFGISLAFIYAILFGLSLKVLIDQVKRQNITRVLIGAAAIIVLINSVLFIRGGNFKLPFRSTTVVSDRISDFNADYYELSDYLKNINTDSRVLWFPFTVDNYIFIQDVNGGENYYAGPSPLQITSGVADYTGGLGFFSYRDDLIKSTINNEANEVSEFFGRMNVGYIVVINNVPDYWKESYFYQYRIKGDLYDAQVNKLSKLLLGKKIADFGERYSLYEISDTYKKDKVSVINTLNDELRGMVTWRKLESSKYEVEIELQSGEYDIQFLDPYHKQWDLILRPVKEDGGKDRSLYNDVSHDLVFSYANSWKLNLEHLEQKYGEDYITKTSEDKVRAKLFIEFKPARYTKWGFASTGVSLLIVGTIYLIASRKKWQI